MREPDRNSQPLFSPEAQPEIEQTGLIWLVGAAIATIILWQVPFGDYILYPFSILATWFHEMGHGLMALLLGGHFHKLEIFANGSGVATYALRSDLGAIGHALVAAGGPMGPPLAGAALILASRKFITASWSLKILGGFLLVSALAWVRSLFGWVAVILLGLVILGVTWKTPRWVQGSTVQFLGVQACVSTYHQMDYLFSYSAGPLGLSDTGQMQKYLLLPYWFWGGLMAIASLAILAQSLRVAYRSE
ncbi:MAG TPA: M50 family metallopeptidase [Nostocaceae cyanobacterium]|nr:M50 family metallopeptidase [Nostocaceae cyanobacterium]